MSELLKEENADALRLEKHGSETSGGDETGHGSGSLHGSLMICLSVFVLCLNPGVHDEMGQKNLQHPR